MRLNLSFLLAVTFAAFSCNNSEQASATNDQDKMVDTVASVTPATETVPVAAPTPYQNQLEMGKIKFTITSPQSPTANTFTVTPSGFAMSNDAITMDCEGTVVQTEVGDLDGDNAPELLVVTQSGEDKKGKAYVFSSNKDKSMSMVGLPDISSEAKNVAGYAGRDEFALVESSFSHRFPLYENGTPTNKTRQFQYKLKAGEAMKQLKLDKTVEF